MDTGLAGRTVVVTGGNSNIGRGVSLAFAAERANVAIAARDEAQGCRVLDEAVDRGAEDTLWCSVDVTDRAQVDEMVAKVCGRFGQIDVLVNNVGGNVDFANFVDSDPAAWGREISLNMVSTLNCTHAVLPAMKGAVHAFTRVLAKEVGTHGITVNAVAPYGTYPDDWERDVSTGSRWHPDGVIARAAATRGEELATIGRRTNLPRQAAFPAEIGAAVVYLASDAAAFVTGQVLTVDGGVLLA
jgi:2-hydroxycyclohexanecarboxyl-CoA dehydrogenase